MSGQTHIVRKQTIELDLTGQMSEALHWQRHLAVFARDVLPSSLERLFDRMAPPGRVVSLESLEVELDLEAAELSDETRLTEAILAKVSEAIAHQPIAGNDGSSNPAGAGEAPGTATEAHSVIGQFFFFLENGQLPWYASQSVRLDFEGALQGVLASGKTKDEWQRRFRLLMQQPSARQRLAWQFSEQTLGAAAAFFFGAKNRELLDNQLFAKQLGKLLPSAAEPLKTAFWDVFFEKKLSGKALVEAALLRFLSQNPAQQEPLLGSLKANGQLALMASLGNRATEEQPKRPKPHPSQSPVPAEGIFVDNAGLVLLHPFLPIFLEELGVAEHGKITDAHKAVHLLQYLATGQEAPPEHLLLLNKLLCGLPLDMPVKRRVKLRKQEKAEARRLLEAAIGHWEALGKSSMENLQGSFLCREGKLTKDALGWRLLVAPMAWDVLMDGLPWGIGVVKLPWMEEILVVEWNAGNYG